MPTIMPIRDLRKTSEISELAHKKQEPIFITKNGYSDLVVMSSELYERFAQTSRTGSNRRSRADFIRKCNGTAQQEILWINMR